MSITQFLAVMQARWKLALYVFLFVVLATAVASLVLPKRYTASTAIVLDVKSVDPVAGGYVPGLMSTTYMATQADIITSDRVARRVVAMLKLTENAEIREQWLQDTGGRGEFDAWLANLLQNNLEVLPSKSSNVIKINFSGVDAKFAALLANAFVQAYTDTTLDLRVEPARQYSGFFDERAKTYREELEKAQSRLSAYQREKGLLATDERLDIENARLAELSSQLVAMQALSAESSSRQAQVRNSADELRDVMTDPIVTGLRAEAGRQQAQLQQLSARLGDAHPQVIELKASIAELRSRIAIETRRVSGSVGVNNSINIGREAQVRAALDQQRIKLFQLKAQRDDALILLKDVETAQKAYDAVLGRLNLTKLDSQNTLTNVGLLSSATEPPFASSPKLFLNLGVAVVLGALLAVAAVLVREFFDRRVRTIEDIAEQLQLPVLCVMPGPAKRPRFGRQPDTARISMQQRVLGLPAATRTA
ncbi:chain length determinant protein EpsF [Rivibacter subsaxonicus]|uniref:Chain length determinant protein EpsF n=1 Tax=Rivibacter subsaxonicus TaxID=457575 RepID=A0A4Q7W158_9BURK|nr:chain length determinant protein EpsF [Rivibacter subsaxonicus]RZU02259.1 chain length determinant protein EpsF [Rivibacter subsaxonicus]